MTTSKALDIIHQSIARIAKAQEPDALRPRVAGEIDMAYKLDLVTYAERDRLMAHMLCTCSARRKELRTEKMKRLGIRE